MTYARLPAALARHATLAVVEALLLALFVTALFGIVGATNGSGTPGLGAADAGKPAPPTGATMSAAPNPIGAGQSFTITGSGFRAGIAVDFQLYEPFCCRFFSMMPDASGRVVVNTTASGAGQYKIEARQKLGGKKATLMATTALTVR